ncbi:hypothetical protein JCM3774_003503 [Rhodotorula dairenensis]
MGKTGPPRKSHHNRMKKKGEAGASKNYITRNQAIKKLQCTLGDFRRLCILKGIYPREPKNRKKANKGSSAPASFYYAKDIQYLLHEPVLHKLREHKAFAKKLSKAVGRGEYGLAKNLEEQKPTYRLDHIIKERYPTFVDSLRDLDDALSLIVLFAALPATSTIPAAVIANCARLAAEWQLYVMRTRSLRKVFLSIKGIYFQAEVHGQTITWLVPYQFTQTIPSDLDYRIMLTFLELYQTLLGFVFYRLYTDINLVYPPKLDQVLDENGAGIGALLLEEAGAKGLVVEQLPEAGGEHGDAEAKEKKRVYAKDVRKQIHEIEKAGAAVTDGEEQQQENDESSVPTATLADAAIELDVFPTPAGTDASDPTTSVTQPSSLTASTDLFAPYFFYISREVTRPTLEFVIRSFGGRVGWDAVLGAGSPYKEDDPRITHHVLDRPVLPEPFASHPGKRAYIQPQWVIDCINRKTLLPTDEYKPGSVLPPHLSPFVDEDEVRERGGYVPAEAAGAIAAAEAMDEDDEDDDEEEEEEDAEMDEAVEDAKTPALLAAAADPSNETLRHAAELEAEAQGVAPGQFEARLAAETKKAAKHAPKKGTAKPAPGGAKASTRTEQDEIKASMMSNSQRRLYKKMTYSQDRRDEETAKLQQRKKDLEKRKRQEAKKAGQ